MQRGRERERREIDLPVNQTQMPCILLHPLLDLVQCI